LFTNNDGILVKEAQILDPGYNDKLDDVFTTLEVRNFILKIRNNKASECDGLPAEVWKRLIIKDGGIQILMQVFNTIRNKIVFPKEWKIALIQPIYKGKGDRKEFGNYRGILLLPVLGKIYLGLLAHRLRDWLMYYNKLTLFQTGFTKGKRTVDNIFIIKTCVDKYLKVKTGKLYWCLVNFEKAFESINREALWYKMRKTGTKMWSLVKK
jgi:hypothetical protein